MLWKPLCPCRLSSARPIPARAWPAGLGVVGWWGTLALRALPGTLQARCCSALIQSCSPVSVTSECSSQPLLLSLYPVPLYTPHPLYNSPHFRYQCTQIQ